MKKKFNLVLVGIVIIMCLLFGTACGINVISSNSVSASASSKSGTANATTSGSTQSNKVDYTFDAESGKLSVFGNGDMADYSMTNIPWLLYKTNIRSIEISDGITSIGNNAFNGCASLTSITIPDSVTEIGYYTFYGCTNLTEVKYDGDIAGWCNITFDYDANPLNNGAELYTKVNGNSEKATDIVIPNTVTEIKYYAFDGCSSLTSITIPDSVTSIGSSAFSGCTSLTSVTIGNSVTRIENNAFGGCTNLTEVKYDGDIAGWCNITFDNEYANPLYYVHNLYMKVNEEYVSVTDIVIPDTVTEIKSSAFSGCTSLTSVTIGNSVTSIGYDAFYGCRNLQYNEYDNGYYLGNENNKYVALIKAKSKYITSCDIHNGTKVIGSDAFSGCTSLTSITIPDSVTSIGRHAFDGCTSLTSITIPDSVTSIGSFAFYGCTSLTSITIPDSVTSIGSFAFDECTSLTSIIVSESNVNYKSIDGNLYSKDGKTLIQYAIGKTAKEFIIPDSVTSIGEYAFYGCWSLTSIIIPDSVTIIGYAAFLNCTLLTSITFSDTTTWYRSISGYYNGTQTDVSDAATNATYFKTLYYYEWYKE